MNYTLSIKVTPNASKNQILGWEGAILRVKIKGVPEKGRVNEELIEFLSEVLGLAKSNISLLSGHTSRVKKLTVQKMSATELREKVKLFL